MSKKKDEVEKTNKTFDVETALNELPVADWIKTTFKETVDVSKIKSQNELEKEFKKYMELKK